VAAQAKGFPNISIVKGSHPVGSLDADKIKKKADDSFEQLSKILTTPLEGG